jgi:hypothetical protein
MAFEDKQAELGLLLTRMQNQPEDRHELYLQIMQKLNELKAYGMPLPTDLVALEERLQAEFEAERVERERRRTIRGVRGSRRRSR